MLQQICVSYAMARPRPSRPSLTSSSPWPKEVVLQLSLTFNPARPSSQGSSRSAAEIMRSEPPVRGRKVRDRARPEGALRLDHISIVLERGFLASHLKSCIERLRAANAAKAISRLKARAIFGFQHF